MTTTCAFIRSSASVTVAFAVRVATAFAAQQRAKLDHERLAAEVTDLGVTQEVTSVLDVKLGEVEQRHARVHSRRERAAIVDGHVGDAEVTGVRVHVLDVTRPVNVSRKFA